MTAGNYRRVVTDTSKTALVTGASSGIGDAFARLLAKKGYDLVVVARDRERLEKLAADLPVDVEVLAADLSDPQQRALVEARLRDAAKPIDVLVNNAGFGTTGRFHELDVERETEEIELNVVALMRLAHAALEGMVRRKRGGIVNVSSIAGFQPTPGTATYGGTKAFVTSFSEALHEELRGTGVTVTCLAPGATRTQFQTTAEYGTSHVPDFMWQTAEEVAASALASLERKQALVVTGWPNKLLAAATHLAPRALVRRVAAQVSNQI